ncbi:hypothetical protein BB934_09765 [Microvirga ossetica]|uniref:Uncharacterized protein n=1 Tax=Microvirga ossetica TaxID=1882682 RepID=A0A1B2EES1_9HYPH|nr:hypothetical protein BB934_09765 [Microvirga ossetica]
MQPPSLMRISGSKAELDFTLADERARIFRDAAAQSVDAAVESFPGRAIAGHVYQSGGLKPFLGKGPREMLSF